MPTVAVVTDSSSSLAVADAERERIRVVPLKVVIGADTYDEGSPEVTADMIAESLATFVPVSTSRPTPEDFLAVYEELAAGGAEAIVSVHLSAKMSGTHDSARLAADRSPIPVAVVDTRQVGLGVGFAAGRAAAARDAGGDVDAVVAAAERAAESTTVLLYVDTLEYLRRGGRVGSAAALIGSALAVKPILTLTDGKVAPLEKVRTTTRALGRLEALTVEAAEVCEDGYDIGVQHLANLAIAEQVAGHLADRLGRDSVPVDEVGAAIGAHVGPGMVSVTVTPR